MIKSPEADVSHIIKYLLFHPYQIFCTTSSTYGTLKVF